MIVRGVPEQKAVMDLNCSRQSSSGPTHLLARKSQGQNPPPTAFLSFYWKYLEGLIIDLGKFLGIDRRNISILLSLCIVLTRSCFQSSLHCSVVWPLLAFALRLFYLFSASISPAPQH